MKRRDFIKKSFFTVSAISPMASLLSMTDKLNAANIGGDYKAIVCLLLEGGADTFNMVVPTNKSLYKDYENVRKHLSLKRETILSINENYGFRKNMSDMQELFLNKNIAIVSNVGTLVKPTTLQEIEDGLAQLPNQLFAHNTQRDLWMLANSKELINRGWAARVADRLYSKPNPYFNVSVDGPNLMQTGSKSDFIEFDDASISPDTMISYGFGPESGGSALGKVYQKLYEQKQNDNNLLMRVFTQKRVKELNRNKTLENLFDNVAEFDYFSTGIHEVGKPLGKQLETVAKILSVKDNFPNKTKRQIFFVNHHGWDTHDSDNEHQVAYLSQSLGAFYKALEDLGLEKEVTTITLSDFGRSLTPNGAGTDHGWGSYAFVMGGAVKGGEIYGKTAQISPNSPDAWQDRVIPTTSVEAYLKPVIKWFGLNDSEIKEIFKNIDSFKSDLEYI